MTLGQTKPTYKIFTLFLSKKKKKKDIYALKIINMTIGYRISLIYSNKKNNKTLLLKVLLPN